MTLKRSKFISFSAHNVQAISLIILIKQQKKENIQTLLALHQQLTLYMYTCLW